MVYAKPDVSPEFVLAEIPVCGVFKPELRPGFVRVDAVGPGSKSLRARGRYVWYFTYQEGPRAGERRTQEEIDHIIDSAEAFVRGFRREQSALRPPTLAGAVKAYITSCKERGMRRPDNYEGRLLSMLWLRGRRGQNGEVNHPIGDREIDTITDELAAKMYESCREDGLRAGSHHSYLVAARAFFEWLIVMKWTRHNPFKKVEKKDRANRGKLQLELHEAKPWTLAAYSYRAAPGSRASSHRVWLDAGVALLVIFFGGFRPSEVLKRKKQDVTATLDQHGNPTGGLTLRVYNGKNEGADRVVDLPPRCSAALREHIKDKLPGDPIFPSLFGPSGSRQITPHMHRICDRAGVPRRCPYSLRGAHGTLAFRVSTLLTNISAGYGHSSEQISLDNYLQDGVVSSARGALLEKMIFAPERATPVPAATEDQELAALLVKVEAAEKKAALMARYAAAEASIAALDEVTQSGDQPESRPPMLALVPASPVTARAA